MEILKRVVVSEHEDGRYKSFPTIVKVENNYIVAYREGRIDTKTPHGIRGIVKIAKSSTLDSWDIFDTPFMEDELDAIISYPANESLLLVTRSHDYKGKNKVFVSRFTPWELPSTRAQIELANSKFTAFGHVRKFNGEFIQAIYGKFDGIRSPALLSSSDGYSDWRLKSLITPKGYVPVLNETSIIDVEDGFVSVMRSMEPSYDLYYSKSRDLVNWSEPAKIGILGHAPMIDKLSDGRLAFVFRDLMMDKAGVSIAIGNTLGDDFNVFNVSTYDGDLYNGGYADFIEVEKGVLFIVYYTSDERNEPWIEGALLKV